MDDSRVESPPMDKKPPLYYSVPSFPPHAYLHFYGILVDVFDLMSPNGYTQNCGICNGGRSFISQFIEIQPSWHTMVALKFIFISLCVHRQCSWFGIVLSSVLSVECYTWAMLKTTFTLDFISVS